MTEQERKAMMNIACTIENEINRICVTDDLRELESMAAYAERNIRWLWSMKREDLTKKGERCMKEKEFAYMAGVLINRIAMLSDDDALARIKSTLEELEELILKYTEEEEEG